MKDSTKIQIINNLSKISDYNVVIEGETTIITYGTKIETYIRIPTESWIEIDKRVKLRRSYPDFDKLNNLSYIIISGLGYQPAIEQLQTQSGAKSTLSKSDCVFTADVPPDILIEALIACKYHKDAWNYHLTYCLGLPTEEEQNVIEY